MKNSGFCPKCGSTAIIGSAYAVAEPSVTVRIAVDGDPRAVMFKEREYSGLEARVCSQCGYVEFHATDAGPLSAADQQAKGRS